MTTTDWIIDIALILIVVRQVREARMDRTFWLVPTVLVGITVHTYLKSLPTAGNDLVLIGAFVALGALLGLAGGLTTRVRAEAGQAYVRAGVTAAGLWIGSMTARLGFIIWISHSGGADFLARFSMHHHITTGDAWQDALVLMALAEVATRVGLLLVRGHRAAAAAPIAPQLVTV